MLSVFQEIVKRLDALGLNVDDEVLQIRFEALATRLDKLWRKLGRP